LATRRQFLKVGVAGAAVLLAVRALEQPLAAPAARHRVLDPASARIVAALAPVVLSGALPASDPARARAVREVVDAFDRAVAGLAPDVQDDISRLLGLLRFAPSRVALTGLWARLDEARPDAIARFLSDWRASRFDLLRAGYQALAQLLNAAWYGNDAAWSAIGYPGPPALDQGTGS
jgi:choline dehydrogenase-like flavoprotein